MALIIKEVSTNTVTEVGNVIIIEGGGLTPDQSTKIDNLPTNTITSLAAKVDKVTGKGLSTNDFDNTYKSKLDNAPSDLNTSLTAKADLVGGKLKTDQIPDSILSGNDYQGLWDASTNTPTISDATGTQGQFYIVDSAGSQDLGSGSITFADGDRAVHNGVIWEKKNQTESVTSVNSQTGNVNITTTTLGIGNVENKSAKTIIGEITESDIPAEIARVSALPSTLDDLTATSTSARISTAEKASYLTTAVVDGKADAISITGTHPETTTAIDFSTVQGKSITLTADRTFTVSTGLSESNPVGLLKITHAGFTPTFSGVTVLDSLLNKSGVYYIKFTRQADGTITQSNQSGGSGATTFDELTDITTTASSVNKIDLILGLYIPDAPTIMTSLSGQDISVTITPGSDNGFTITGYKVEVNSGSGWATVVASTSENPYLIEAPGEGTHQVRVSSINAIGTSAASNIDSETIAGSTVDIILNLANSGVGEVSSPDANGLYCNNLNLAGDWTTLRELLTAGNVVNVNGDTVAGVSVHLTSAVIDAGTNGDKLTNEGSIMTPQYFNHVWESRLTQGSFAIEVRGLSAGASFTAIGSGGYANSNNTTSRLVMNSTNGTTWEPNGADVSTFSTVTANSDGSGVLNIQGDNVNNDGRTPVGAIRITAN